MKVITAMSLLVVSMGVSSVSQAMMALNCTEVSSLDDEQVGYCVEQESGFMKDNLEQLGKTYTHLSWDKIQSSQQAWEAYSEANCAFHELNAGGGGADVRALNECRVRLMVERNAELEKMASH